MRDITIYHEKPPCNEQTLRNHMMDLMEIIVPPLEGRVIFEDYIKKIIENANVFYAIDENVICGSCIVYLNQETGYITSIGVMPNYRRHGIGTQLLDEVVSYAKQMDINEISLSVWGENEKAIQFYKNYGFHIDNENTTWIKMKFKME